MMPNYCTLRGVFCVHKTSIDPTMLFKCLYQVRKVQCVNFVPGTTIVLLDFGTVSSMSYLFCFPYLCIGPSIIAHRNMSLINGKGVLSIYVSSDPRITDIIWMREIFGKTTDNGSARSSMESIRNGTVTILIYVTRVTVQGQRIEFNILELKVTNGRYVCQIRNEHGLKEASINIVEIASLLHSHERPTKRNTTG